MTLPVKLWRGQTFNQRTIDMLEAAEELLGGYLAIIQGSYNVGGVTQSAGTHDGGGAVDCWPVDGLGEQAVAAMRAVGFAAWVRDPSQGDWNYHIHAIAIGDPDLSSGAATQVTSYYAGGDGLSGDVPDYHPRPNPIPVWSGGGDGGGVIVVGDGATRIGPGSIDEATPTPISFNQVSDTPIPGGDEEYRYWSFQAPTDGYFAIDSWESRLADGEQPDTLYSTVYATEDGYSSNVLAEDNLGGRMGGIYGMESGVTYGIMGYQSGAASDSVLSLRVSEVEVLKEPAGLGIEHWPQSPTDIPEGMYVLEPGDRSAVTDSIPMAPNQSRFFWWEVYCPDAGVIWLNPWARSTSRYYGEAYSAQVIEGAGTFITNYRVLAYEVEAGTRLAVAVRAENSLTYSYNTNFSLAVNWTAPGDYVNPGLPPSYEFNVLRLIPVDSEIDGEFDLSRRRFF